MKDLLTEIAELIPNATEIGSDEVTLETGWTVWLDSEWSETWSVSDPDGETVASCLTREEALDILQYREAW